MLPPVAALLDVLPLVVVMPPLPPPPTTLPHPDAAPTASPESVTHAHVTATGAPRRDLSSMLHAGGIGGKGRLL